MLVLNTEGKKQQLVCKSMHLQFHDMSYIIIKYTHSYIYLVEKETKFMIYMTSVWFCMCYTYRKLNLNHDIEVQT